MTHPSQGIRIKWYRPIEDPKIVPIHKAMMASLKRSGFMEVEPGFWQPSPQAKVPSMPKSTRRSYLNSTRRQRCEAPARKGYRWYRKPLSCRADATVFEQWNQFCDRHAAKLERRQSWECVEHLLQLLEWGVEFSNSYSKKWLSDRGIAA